MVAGAFRAPLRPSVTNGSAVSLDLDSSSSDAEGTTGASVGKREPGKEPGPVPHAATNKGDPKDDSRGTIRSISYGSGQTAASKSSRRRVQEKHRDREAAERGSEVALARSADRVFQAFCMPAGQTAAAEGNAWEGECLLTVEALGEALIRYRVPSEMCGPDEVEEMLALGAKRAGMPLGPLSLETFQALFATLGLKVTRDGRVW